VVGFEGLPYSNRTRSPAPHHNPRLFLPVLATHWESAVRRNVANRVSGSSNCRYDTSYPSFLPTTLPLQVSLPSFPPRPQLPSHDHVHCPSSPPLPNTSPNSYTPPQWQLLRNSPTPMSRSTTPRTTCTWSCTTRSTMRQAS
jgi:hypothetical protein